EGSVPGSFGSVPGSVPGQSQVLTQIVKWRASRRAMILSGRDQRQPAGESVRGTDPSASRFGRAKMLAKEFLTALFSFLSQYHRFCFTHRIKDHSFFVETIHRIPIMSFPGAPMVVQGEKKKCEHHFVDFVFVVVHEAMLPFRSRSFNRLRLSSQAGGAEQVRCSDPASGNVVVVLAPL